MSKKYLGESIDIHAGGEDLIFPHHENEIAQSECANGKTFANYWMHNAFLNIDNRKMSKSLGNFFTVREISEKYDLQVLRLFMLSAQYRSPLNFSADLMEASKNSLERIRTAAEHQADCLKAAKEGEMTAEEKQNQAAVEELVQKFETAMDDDFNTADAISAIFEIVRLSNSTISEASTKAYVSYVKETMDKLCDVLGIITEKKEEILDSEVEDLIAKRQQARKDKNFALADEIRTLVMNRGNMQVNKMHKKTANLVKADAQARFYLLLEEELTDAEKAVYRRGRNAKSFTMPKHATMKDYRMATGFEALMGYLYLTEQFDRMAELLGKGLEQMGELAEAEGTSTDSHALQEAENEK